MEANENIWMFSFSSDQIKLLDIASIKKFIEDAFQIYKVKYDQIGGVFYCWYDEMAAQLRFGSVSSKHKRLPFRCDFQLVDDIELILQNMFRSDDESSILRIWTKKL
jgi:hypothetical protein